MSLLFGGCTVTTIDNGGDMTPPIQTKTPIEIAQESADRFGIDSNFTEPSVYITRLQNPIRPWEVGGQTTALSNTGDIYDAYHLPNSNSVRPLIAVVGDIKTVSLYTKAGASPNYLSLEIVYVNKKSGYTKIITPFPADDYDTAWLTKPTGFSLDVMANLGHNYLIFIHVLKIDTITSILGGGRILNGVKK